MVPPVCRTSSYNQSSSSSSSGLRIKGALKSEYLITLPPLLSVQVGDFPQSNFHLTLILKKGVWQKLRKVAKTGAAW